MFVNAVNQKVRLFLSSAALPPTCVQRPQTEQNMLVTAHEWTHDALYILQTHLRSQAGLQVQTVWTALVIEVIFLVVSELAAEQHKHGVYSPQCYLVVLQSQYLTMKHVGC